MCPGSCAVFLCADCKKAARDDKQGAAERDELRLELVVAKGDVEAHRLRCEQLETQLETAKRAELESDRRAKEAEALADAAIRFRFDDVTVSRIAGPASAWWVSPRDKDSEMVDTRDEAIARARALAKGGGK